MGSYKIQISSVDGSFEWGSHAIHANLFTFRELLEVSPTPVSFMAINSPYCCFRIFSY